MSLRELRTSFFTPNLHFAKPWGVTVSTAGRSLPKQSPQPATHQTSHGGQGTADAVGNRVPSGAPSLLGRSRSLFCRRENRVPEGNDLPVPRGAEWQPGLQLKPSSFPRGNSCLGSTALPLPQAASPGAFPSWPSCNAAHAQPGTGIHASLFRGFVFNWIWNSAIYNEVQIFNVPIKSNT